MTRDYGSHGSFVLVQGNTVYHLNVKIPDHQEGDLCWIRDYTGLTISEFTRRLYDYAFQERVLNEVIPSMSGRLHIETR